MSTGQGSEVTSIKASRTIEMTSLPLGLQRATSQKTVLLESTVTNISNPT